MIRIDLHTHSKASPDGSLSLDDYQAKLTSGKLNCIAITDHDRIDFAMKAQATLGSAIIVGQEITSSEGEIIGLYLTEAIPAGLSALETAEQIHKQGGLVYIPHPFETVRKGIRLETLDAIAKHVNIIETYNGRSMQNRGQQAVKWASKHHGAMASSSDAHGNLGWGKTYTILSALPQRQTLLQLLAQGTIHAQSTGLIGRLYPKFNRLRNRR